MAKIYYYKREIWNILKVDLLTNLLNLYFIEDIWFYKINFLALKLKKLKSAKKNI